MHARRKGDVDKQNFKRKNEFASYANAKHFGGMFLPTWSMVDEPIPIGQVPLE